MIPAIRDTFEDWDRVYLEKLRLAANVILQAGEDPGFVQDTFLDEMFRFRDRIDRALLLKIDTATGTLVPRTATDPAHEPDNDDVSPDAPRRTAHLPPSHPKLRTPTPSVRPETRIGRPGDPAARPVPLAGRAAPPSTADRTPPEACFAAGSFAQPLATKGAVIE